MLKSRLTSILFILLCHGSAHTCSCIYLATFCEAMERGVEWAPMSTLAVRGLKIGEVKVDEYRSDMIFEVTESFYNPLAIKTIRVLDGNGANCTQSVQHYPMQQELILHLWTYQDSNQIIGSISSCEPAPLEVTGNMVIGEIADGKQEMALDAFRKLLNCGFQPLITRIFPNPASDFITVEFSREASIAGGTIFIYNALGLQLYNLEITDGNSFQYDIKTFDWPPAIYYLRMRSNGRLEDYPFAVMR